MNQITFCIPTAKNEREYIRLLIKSLQENTDLNKHEVLVFVDSDNQNTYDMLLTLKKTIPNLRICKNSNLFPIGGQRNISIMFNAASNDIVCYLQSDMVVGKDFDKHIIDNIREDIVLSCARIEPPLHPSSPDKITKDFGITPETFDFKSFNKFVDTLQLENRPNIEAYFAPFVIYKKTWMDILGGFDTQFRCSREDSDIAVRMNLSKLKTIQNWNACVYHFTCVSSRGQDWYKQNDESNYKNELQLLADQQELKRFIRKWGFFGHYPKPVYDITFNIKLDQYIDFNLLKKIEPYCSRMYISDKNIVEQLIHQLEFESQYYSNIRWNYTDEYWEEVKYLFNLTNFKNRILFNHNIIGDTIIEIKYSDLKQYWNDAQNFIENIQNIIDQTEVGLYDGGFCKIYIHSKNNIAYNHIKCDNINLILNDKEFKFI
jgi:GT2 family glycosyltransferase